MDERPNRLPEVGEDDIAAAAERIAQVRAVMAAACARVGRRPEDVELVAVSKLQPLRLVAAAAAAGQRVFGENYAQDLRDRAALFAAAGVPAAWHAIGPLQRNKVKYVARSAAAFHALDRLEIAQALGEKRQEVPRSTDRGWDPLPCYLEVNVAGEATKHGVAPAEVPALADAVRAVPGIALVGLMCMPPPSESSRPYFGALRALAASVGLAGLSMGTTSDYAVAIEEGATVVRVGRELFGPR